MTRADLKRMGVVYVGSKIYPNKFFIPLVGNVNLYEPYSLDTIFKIIHDSGYEEGVKQGEAKKIAEIKRILNIEDGQ